MGNECSHFTAADPNSLYSRLGGVFAIAAVVDYFSDLVIDSPLVGIGSANPFLRNWSGAHSDRLPGLKWMRTLWVVSVSGGPYQYQGTHPDPTEFGLANAHARFHITSAEFDEVARLLEVAMDFYHVPPREKQEVLQSFGAHKGEVTAGSRLR